MKQKNSGEWHEFIERTAGSLAEDPIVRPAQGEYEEREWPEREHAVTVSREQQIENLKNMGDEEIDLSDAPEATTEQLERLQPLVLKGSNRPKNKT